MEKPLFELKRFVHRVSRLGEKLSKQHGLDYMAGPQGQVLHFLAHREETGKKSLIRDIEQKMEISKSVASNLVKRMEQNDLIYLESSQDDKRAKYVYLTERAKANLSRVRDFYDEMDRCVLEGVTEEEVQIFEKVLHQFQDNLERRTTNDSIV